MSLIETQLTVNEKTITHQGTSGITITGLGEGRGVETLIEYSPTTADEMRELVCVLLCMLDDLKGEQFVASCFARYAEETGKKFLSEGNGRKLVMIRGESN